MPSKRKGAGHGGGMSDLENQALVGLTSLASARDLKSESEEANMQEDTEGDGEEEGGSEGKPKKWSTVQKMKHSVACRRKERLTLADKLEIIKLHESALPDERKSQGELATMFGKSRMTISKLLRPETIAKTKGLANAGVRLESKRCKRAQYPELEGRLYERLGMGSRPVTKGEVMQVAEELVVEMGIMDLEVSNNWCTRFIKQHDLSVGGQGAAARKPVAKWKPAQLAEGISPAAMANAARCKDATDTKARYEAQLRYEAAEALFKYEAAESRLRALRQGAGAQDGVLQRLRAELMGL